MSSRFQHHGHVVRVAVLFAAGFLTFLVARAWLIPADFGVYGFYRAGALDAVRAQPIKYAGQTPCLDCHAEVDELRQTERHRNVSCEACHGPSAAHVEDFSIAPATLDPRALCLRCHTALAGKPDFMPQIVPADHFEDAACTECHAPHAPKQ
ncbi:MAG: multiheme c-type cytochrome [Vicinamibacterales bacterium]